MKTLSKIFKRSLIKGPNKEYFVKILKLENEKFFNKNLIKNFKKGPN